MKDKSAPTLEERIAGIESGEEAGTDFGTDSWLWMILFGVIVPIALLTWGWFG